MVDNYIVNYDIDVKSADAVTAIQNFQTAINNLTALGSKLTEFQKKMNAITNKMPKMDVSTSKINTKLDAVIRKLEKIHKLAKTVPAVNTKTLQNPQPKQQHNPTGSRSANRGFAHSYVNRGLPKNLSYKLLGPTPLDVGGMVGLDFLKGMGLAYGIAGAGTLIGKTIREATEYNNLMQTAKNILKTHDRQPDFEGRFAQMEQIVRNVGVETKFTAPQVADAAKFLAMAGLDVNAINQSIRPIADIALIGDTELGETADVVTNIMTGYGIGADKVRNAADIMTMTFTKSNTTLMEIAEAYKYSASLLAAGGVDFEEATAAIGVLGNAGIKGSQAGTTMRTIMANIVNPTKKQLTQWQKIGVERFDENGKLRDLVDIFEDLSKAELYVSDFYKLFHKTAAQGAVSLANNVDKWNEIIADNFMSDGVAKELADEKKNTIAGLWAQLTSAFTETGMKAFEVITPSIKTFLGDMTEWIKSDSTVEAMKGFSRELMGFIKDLVEITKDFLEWGSELKGLIKIWLKFQINMMPVMFGLRAFKGFLGLAPRIKQFAGQIAVLTGRFVALTRTMKTMHAYNILALTGSKLSFGAWTSANFYNAAFNKNVRPEVWQRYWNIHPQVRQTGSLMIGKSIGGLAGGALAGSQIGEAFGLGHTGKLLTGALGGLAGYAALLFGGPAGIATAAVLGIGGLVAALINVKKKTDAAREAWEKYTSSFEVVDGILTGDNLSKTEIYLDIVYNKQLSINDVISKRIELMKEELGLQDMPKVNSSLIDGKVAKEFLSKVPNAGGATYVMDEMNRWFGSDHSPLITKKFLSGMVVPDYYWNGEYAHYPLLSSSGESIQALSALYMEGFKGSMTEAAITDFDKKLARAALLGSKEGFDAIKREYADRYGTMRLDTDVKTIPSSFGYRLSDIESWIENGETDKLQNSYTLQIGAIERMEPMFGANAPVWKAVEDYFNALTNNAFTQPVVMEYLSKTNSEIGAALKGFDFNNSNYNDWAKTLGYWDDTFHNMENHDALTVAKTTKGYLDNVLKAIPKLPEAAQTPLHEFVRFAKHLHNLADHYITEFDGSGTSAKVMEAKEGDTIQYNGETWTYTNGMWVSDSGTMNPLDNATMQALVAGDSNTANSGNNATPDPSDYNANYRSSSAAPKQIIVKIGNLMNVESIDMSDPNNVAVVTTIKEQLAQALIDVVSDFSNNINN